MPTAGNTRNLPALTNSPGLPATAPEKPKLYGTKLPVVVRATAQPQPMVYLAAFLTISVSGFPNEALNPGQPHPPDLRRHRSRHAADGRAIHAQRYLRVHLAGARRPRARGAVSPSSDRRRLQLADSQSRRLPHRRSRARADPRGAKHRRRAARLREHLPPSRRQARQRMRPHRETLFMSLSRVELRHRRPPRRDSRRLRIRRSRSRAPAASSRSRSPKSTASSS